MSRFVSVSSSIRIMAAAVLVLLSVGILLIRTEGVPNNSASAGMVVGKTIEDEGDLINWKTSNDDFTDSATRDGDEQERHQLDGGFSSLDAALQWAIGHSDPARLKETAQGIQHHPKGELTQHLMEAKELLEKLKMPSDSELMKIAIDDLDNSSLSSEDRLRALQELLILVEPIHNANDLHKLGGLTAVIRELKNPNPEIRTISAWVLGKASQNNPIVQNQILELGALPKLIEMAGSDCIEEALKALYTISALIRNNLGGQELFYIEAGDVMLQQIISNSSIDVRLHRKSVSLVADLVNCQVNHRIHSRRPFFSDHSFLKSIVDLMSSPDLDLQEKALHAVKDLLLLESTNALVFKDVCELDLILRRMRLQLQKLILEDEFKEYALDVENFLTEVELIFLGKLNNVKAVPT